MGCPDERIPLGERKGSLLLPGKALVFPVEVSGPAYSALKWIKFPRAGDDLWAAAGLATESQTSIRIPRAGDDSLPLKVIHCTNISIHIPRAGDDGTVPPAGTSARISIHIPRAGDDFQCSRAAVILSSFQSTSPVRGMTAGTLDSMVWPLFQSTSPVRGMTQTAAGRPPRNHISIHIPLTGDDDAGPDRPSEQTDFNPHPPHGG